MADGSAPLAFPDAPRGRLDRVINDLVASAQEVLATQGRLRSLLEASRTVSSELELPVVLRTIVAAAVELVGSRYGAIGVIAPDGSLAQFIHVGVGDELAREIGHLPEGHGLLGALIEDQEPIRLEHLRDDARSSGFPAHHPPMESFLGVPVRVRGEVYGNLYLTERIDGPFTAEDEELLSALAATAGAAIDHARLFDESQRRQRWSAASAEVTSALLSEETDDSLGILADRVAQLADAELVCVALPAAGTTMSIVAARGSLAASYIDGTFDAEGTLAGRAYEIGQPVMSDAESLSKIDPDLVLGPTMAIPFTSAGAPPGVLTVSRSRGRAAFTSADLEMAADFAGQASVALTLAAGRADRARLAVLEDRGRIARDLHDHVIQRLFGAGLSLQAAAAGIQDAALRARVAQQVDVLDAAIAEIRTAIFTLNIVESTGTPLLRHRVLDVVAEMADLFDESPHVTFSGAVDLMIDAALAEDVIAVVREGLSNVGRHAAAQRSSISVAVNSDAVTIEIADDGRGMPESATRSSGTANLEQRATARGGTFTLTSPDSGGTVLVWNVPLAAERAEP
jgi:signal transduction histidine kinase